MTECGVLLFTLATVLITAPPLPAQAATPDTEKAGKVSALLPVAHIVRGAGKEAATREAGKGDELVWNDLVKTQRGGRARITLVDQSILSLGSQAELKIARHDGRSQQTVLQLGYGRLRAEVSKMVREGDKFELRTPTAVAGVIGTDFGTDASEVGTTKFLCISGTVEVSNIDPNVPGTVQCAAGMTTSVGTGTAPTPPTEATAAEIQQLIQDTEPAIITAISPVFAFPGDSTDAAITGRKLSGITKVEISGEGVAASLASLPTDTSATVHLVIDAAAAPGPRTITLIKENEAASAAVFTVLSPPGEPEAEQAPKDPYAEVFAQERVYEGAGLSAYLAEVRQARDAAMQLLQQANRAGLDLSDAISDLNAEIAAVEAAVESAEAQTDAAAAAAMEGFDTQYQSASDALDQRSLDGTPDDTFNQELQTSFEQVNTSLSAEFNSIDGEVAAVVQTASDKIAQLQQKWLATLTAPQPPTPAVNNIERSIDLGAAFGSGNIAALDAGNSKAAGGASIVRYQWVLCDASYKPAQFGVPIVGTATGCNALSGFTSSTSDFSFETCSLDPGDYMARVTVYDSAGQAAAMDVKIHVLPPTYDDPATLLRGLAAAYTSLQMQQFLNFFDQANFPGYDALAENIRNSFPTLGTMNINLLVSQSSISCTGGNSAGEATVRADWELNYTFKKVCEPIANTDPVQQACSDPSLVLQDKEQLSVRMTRTPGKGWFITDFQGDNGKVQSVPVVASADSSAPDLAVTAVYPGYATQGSATAVPVPAGTQTFTAVVANVGRGEFRASTLVVFGLSSGGTATVPLPAPLQPGASKTVTATLNVSGAPNAAFTVSATVDPDNSVVESSYANNSLTVPFSIGAPIMEISAPLSFVAGGNPQTLQVTVSAATMVTLNLSSGIALAPGSNPLSQTFSAPGTATWTLQASPNATSGTITITAGGYTLPVTHTVAGLTLTQGTIPTLTVGGGPQTLSFTTNDPGTYTLSLPTGINVCSDLVCSSAGTAAQTASGNAVPYLLTWYLKADFSAAAGTNLSTSISHGGLSGLSVQYSVAGPTFTPGSTPMLVVDGLSKLLTVNVNVPGTFRLNLPSGITLDLATCSTCTQTQTLANPGTLTWHVQAGSTAALGTLTTPVTAMIGASPSVYSASLPYVVLPPGSPIQPTIPNLYSGGTSQALTLTFDSAGTYSLVTPLPTGISIDAAKTPSNTQAVSAGGSLTWYLQASVAAAPGANLTNIFVTNGTANWPVIYTVTGVPNYTVTSVVIKEDPSGLVVHNPPYTGANAFQADEKLAASVTVANTGNGSPAGMITVTFTCTGPGSCTPATTQVAAPAQGTSVTAPDLKMAAGTSAGSYTMAFSLTAMDGSNNPIPQTSTADDSWSAAVQQVDFSLAVVGSATFDPTQPQNFLLSSTQQMTVNLTETGASAPFNIPLDIGPQYVRLTFTPTSISAAPGAHTFSIFASWNMYLGPRAISVSGVNHGVYRSASQVMNFMTADLVFSQLVLNDASNPMTFQVGSASPQVVRLRAQTSAFSDAITLLPPVSSYFSFNVSPSTVSAGGTTDWQITATSPDPNSVDTLRLTGQIPNSNPVTTIYKDLYVKTIQVPDLEIVSATPSRLISSSAPWIDGEPIDFSVVVRNNGSVPSAGGENIICRLHGYDVGRTTAPPLAGGASTTVTLHCVAPDIDGNSTVQTTAAFSVRVEPDPAGDVNYANNKTADVYYAWANWHVSCPCSNQDPATYPGSGTASDPFKVDIGPGMGYGTIVNVTIHGTVDGGGTSASFVLDSGVYNTNAFTVSWGPTSTGSITFDPLRIRASATPIQSGIYIVQGLAGLLDGATRTARRQVTIYFNIIYNPRPTPTDTLTLTSSANNCLSASSGGACANATADTVQINGKLVEQVGLSVSRSGCDPAVAPCGSVDLSFTDATNTATNPLSATLSFGQQQTIQVGALLDPDGLINSPGPVANYTVSATAVQLPVVAARAGQTPSPSPAGITFQLAFNIGDINLTPYSASCVNVAPGGSVTLSFNWQPVSGFNAPLQWEWEDSSYVHVGTAPLSFTPNSGSDTSTTGVYSPLPAFTLRNTQAVDGLRTYFFAVTATNAFGSATKYFPFYFDVSTSQNLCGALLSSARGFAGVRGTWNRTAAGAGGATASAVRPRTSTGPGQPDLRLSASEVSFSPSLPKAGDTIQVRFRVSNQGDADARGVPIALQVSGVTVAMDTFDVPAGSTALGGLDWKSASVPSGARVGGAGSRPLRLRDRLRDGDAPDEIERGPARQSFPVQLVIDPQRTITQKTTLGKAVALPHFTLREAVTSGAPGIAGTPAATAGSQRVLLELQEGSCVGLRLLTGSAGPCGTADVEITADDAGKSGITLNSLSGVADMGTGFAAANIRFDRAQLAGARYAMQTAGVAGHSYAVKLSNGQAGLLTIVSLRKPGQLSAVARKVFRANATRILRRIGGNTGPAEPDEVASSLFLEAIVQTQ